MDSRFRGNDALRMKRAHLPGQRANRLFGDQSSSYYWVFPRNTGLVRLQAATSGSRQELEVFGGGVRGGPFFQKEASPAINSSQISQVLRRLYGVR